MHQVLSIYFICIGFSLYLLFITSLASFIFIFPIFIFSIYIFLNIFPLNFSFGLDIPVVKIRVINKDSNSVNLYLFIIRFTP